MVAFSVSQAPLRVLLKYPEMKHLGNTYARSKKRIPVIFDDSCTLTWRASQAERAHNFAIARSENV